MPDHITQRGNRRQQVFFSAGDDAACLELLAEWCGEDGVNAFLASAAPEEELAELYRHVRTGCPLGDDAFVGQLEAMVGRLLKPRKRRPKPKDRGN